MRKWKFILPAAVLAVLLTHGALAGCQDENAAFSPASSLILKNKGVDATSPGGENWKEDHCRLGQLFKVGDGSAVDPRVQTGTWIGQRGGIVHYNYGDPAGPYEWKLYSTGSSVGDSVCWENPDTGAVVAIGTLKALSGLCP